MPVKPSASRSTWKVDYALVGGGLQNGLIAFSLMKLRPSATFAVIERGRTLGGNHLWSFHAGDVAPNMRAVFSEFVSCRWERYRVAFPTGTRELDEPYACISSANFHDKLVRRCSAHPGAVVLTGVDASRIEPHRVILSNGCEVEAEIVVDGRGPSGFQSPGAVAFQKFVGLELRVRRSLRDAVPMLMDARVPQRDGFRFFYVLPLAEDRVLVEETYFSDSPEVDVDLLRAQIVAYAVRHGMEPVGVVREERGVLPLPSRMPLPPKAVSPLRAGYGGGWFHPTTGYSFPIAARVAELVAGHDTAHLCEAWKHFQAAHARQARFCTFLNRLLYGFFAPEARWNVLERFYRLPAPTIRRFYAMTTTSADRARILCGRPPKGISFRYATRAVTSPEGAIA